MDNKKAKIRHLYDSTFHDPKVWTDWFFDNVYADHCVMTLTADGMDGDSVADATPASMLMMQPYTFGFHGEDVGLAYISCAATARRERGKGLMGTLLDMALMRASDSGLPLAALIPATDRLYFYYDRHRFATVVFADVERYTAVHRFENSGCYVACPPDFDTFSRLERRRDCTVRHTALQMDHIMADARLDGGDMMALRDIADGTAHAIAVAVPGKETLKVKMLMADNADAASAMLQAIRERWTGMPMEVWSAPGGREASLRSRAMMRVLDAGGLLSVLARRNPEVRQTIRLHDYLIERNNGIFDVADGVCRRINDCREAPRLTLDVEIDVFTRLLFSSHAIGEVFGLPSCHPMLPLMLD